MFSNLKKRNKRIPSQLPFAKHMLTYFPQEMANRSVLAYVVALLASNLLFFNSAMPIWLWIFGFISVLLFFYGSNFFTKAWYKVSEKSFTKQLFWWALGIRVIYVLFIYIFNQMHYGTYYESNSGDITWYVPSALQMAEQFSDGNWSEVIQMWLGWDIQISDLGYVIYLAIIYLLTGSYSEVVLPLLLKAIYGATVCVMMYHIAKRHFGESVGRMTAIFCMLQSNLIWWCGSMMKETEMILLTIWFVYEMDKVLTLGKLKLQNLTKAILLGASLFAFRSALALIAFASMFIALLFTKSTVVKTGTKMLVGILVAIVLAFSFGDNLLETVQETQTMVEGGKYQETNMEWRGRREHGNSFAKYAGAAVFAPLIFSIPFPSMVYTFQGQEMQMMVNGGNFQKNILSFFVIMVMITWLFSGEWRKHTFILVFLLGYLVALVLSVFAQSGRFHMPIMPLLMMFAAYGISLFGKTRINKFWFNWVLVLEVIVCIAWAWFKLAGRGMA